MGKQETAPQPISENVTMDRGEFAEHFCLLHKRLWLLATALVGDRTQADDIVQEATLIAWRKRTDFQSDTNFAAWVAAIVRRCSMNYVRKMRTRGTLPTDPNTIDMLAPANPEGTPLAIESTGELGEYQSHFDDEVLRALNSFTPEARCCLLLRTVHQLSYAEISELLDMPEGTAMSHVHRTKRSMRRQLSTSHDRSRGPKQ